MLLPVAWGKHNFRSAQKFIASDTKPAIALPLPDIILKTATNSRGAFYPADKQAT